MLQSLMMSVVSRLNMAWSWAVLALAISAAPALAQTAPTAIEARAAQQIAVLVHEKAGRTPAERKMSSRLVLQIKRTLTPSLAAVPLLRTAVPTETGAGGAMVTVDISGNITAELLARIAAVGGTVVNAQPPLGAVRARLPLAQVEGLAALPAVRQVRPAVQARPHGQTPQPMSRAATGATNAATSTTATTSAGAVDTQGDVTHRASEARATFGATGAGVKVGVISDSVDGLAAAQSAGELGAVTVLSNRSGTPDTGEGTAMLEIVHDLAPNAQLYFSTGNGGPAAMAQNILDLQSAGCSIIVDDLYYYNESPFQDGPIAQAINTVTAKGVLYFTAAGNNGNKDHAHSATWEGDYVAGSTLRAPDGSSLGTTHLFGSTAYDLYEGSDTENATLFWSDPLGAAADDYDLYVEDSSGNIVDASTDTQNGSADPYEIASVKAGERLVVVKYAGAARFLHLGVDSGPLQVGTTGAIAGHSGTPNAVSVAATDATTSYPNAFSGGSANPAEFFSSDGWRRMFYRPDGSAYTAGNFSNSGGTVVQKPDITAADGVHTSLSGFNPFYGTSAAAPHAAAIAALIQSYKPGLLAAQVLAAMKSTALNIETAGVDRDSGSGIVMAYQALASLTTTANSAPSPVSVTPSSGSSGAGAPRTLTTVYSDPNGAADINWAYFRVSATASNTNALLAAYNPVTGLVYMGNDSGSFTTSAAIGSSNVLSNSQGSVSCSAMRATQSGNNLTVVWSFTPAAGYTGAKNLYLYVIDKAGLSGGWTSMGTWTITAGPADLSLSPASGASAAGTARSLTAIQTDPTGASSITTSRLLVNTTANGANALYAYYARAANKLYLRNDANSAWLGGFAPGSSNLISNSQGSLNCAATTVTVSGNQLTIHWSLTPKAAFAGARNVYLYALDSSGLHVGLAKMGTWTITTTATAVTEPSRTAASPDGGSPISSATVDAGSDRVTLTFVAPLDPATALDPFNYEVAIDGETVPVTSARCTADGMVVTLQLPRGTLQPGDDVTVRWGGGLLTARGGAAAGQVVVRK